MSWVRASIICALSATAALACSSGGELPKTRVDEGPPPASGDPNQIQLPFLVDDYFVPNGCFGDADCGGDTIDIDSHGCDDPPASVQSVCRIFTYTPLAKGAPGYQNFLGILFQDAAPPDKSGIGMVPGLPIEPGAKRVVFWAKLGSGSFDVVFRAGGANNWNGDTDPSLPYKDTFGVPKKVRLGSDYQQIAIDLSGVSYSDVVSPFGWSIESNGRTEPIALYIADVRWE